MLAACNRHWGNIGSFLAGVNCRYRHRRLRQGPAVVRAWIDRAHGQAEGAREAAENSRLERQRYLSGWSAHGIWTYAATLVTGKDEPERRRATAYVVLRMTQGGSGDENAAASLR